MKLWLIARTDKYGYDEYDSFVVRAASKESALALVEKKHKSWARDHVEVTLLGTATRGSPAMIVLASFNAG